MSGDREPIKRNGDDVAALVRLAGPRPPVPVERMARARTVALTTWRLDLRRRSRGRYLWAAALLAAAASGVLVLLLRGEAAKSSPAPAMDSAILVESLSGPASVRDGAGPARALGPDDELALGCQLSTADEGRVALRLPSGHSLRLDRSTRVRLLDRALLVLDRGAVYVDSKGAGADPTPLSVRTPFGRVEEIGTQFEVRLEPAAVRVRLREGKVIVTHDAQVHEVGAGMEFAMSADGSSTQHEIATHGAGWEWVAEITPMLDLENRTARAFLDWVAREQGLRLAFANEAVARSAAEIVLAGTTQRMTLDEALDAVLPSCRMTHRVAGGELWVDSMPQDERGAERPLRGTRAGAES